jgi:hypothetical protein
MENELTKLFREIFENISPVVYNKEFMEKVTELRIYIENMERQINNLSIRVGLLENGRIGLK